MSLLHCSGEICILSGEDFQPAVAHAAAGGPDEGVRGQLVEMRHT